MRVVKKSKTWDNFLSILNSSEPNQGSSTVSFGLSSGLGLAV